MPKSKKNMKRPGRIGFHVCIPLYKGIPKEAQSGWVEMGDRQVKEWDNTTILLLFLLMNPKLDQKLYCGTCGRLMTKGRNKHIDKSPTAKRIELLPTPIGGSVGPYRIEPPQILLPPSR